AAERPLRVRGRVDRFLPEARAAVAARCRFGFAEIIAQKPGAAAGVASVGEDLLEPGQVAALSVGEASGHTLQQWFADRAFELPESDPRAGGLELEVAVLLQVVERRDDPAAGLARLFRQRGHVEEE